MNISQAELQLLQELTDIHGVSGDEQEVATYLAEKYRQYGEIIRDPLGNVFVVRRSNNPNAKKVMVTAHMDEVGFIVKDILPHGGIKFLPIGGIFDQTLLGSRVKLKTRQGKIVSGCISVMPPHFLSEAARQRPVTIEDMIIDIGANDAQEALAMGVFYGDHIVVDAPFVVMNDKRLLAKALDNRLGCALSVVLLEKLSALELDYHLYVGATVQEEVGSRGAEVAVERIDPDFALVLECSPATDLFINNNTNAQLGNGVLVRFYDRTMLMDRQLMYDFKELCQKQAITHQMFYSLGGTDGGTIHLHRQGVSTLVVCIGGRNMHSSSTVIDLDDYVAMRESTFSFLKQLTSEAIARYRHEDLH